ncbi:MAG TPA: ribonuclease M5 [Anaerovoracaceae bacterium]|nr:ribonuclease M5 [Anaerovoracaceae bacterium]
MKPQIDKIIVVEGKNDESAVKAAVDAEVIVTSGFSISRDTWSLIEKAYAGPGILVFTDPDFAGECIRNRIKESFPKCTHAYMAIDDARKNSDIGIENASKENIIAALEKAIVYTFKPENTFTMDDLFYFNLAGSAQASARRGKIGKAIGVGSCNAKAFLARLNSFGITREEFYRHGQTLFTGDCEENNK